MLGDLEALRLGVVGAYYFDSRKDGKIWPLSFGYQIPVPARRDDFEHYVAHYAE